MDTEKKKTLADFSRRALQRLNDKKIPKRQTLHIPSMDMELTIRSLDYGEIMECMTLEDNGDIKRSDKYSIYLAAVEPNLRDVAREIMGQEAELPPEERELKDRWTSMICLTCLRSRRSPRPSWSCPAQ